MNTNSKTDSVLDDKETYDKMKCQKKERSLQSDSIEIQPFKSPFENKYSIENEQQDEVIDEANANLLSYQSINNSKQKLKGDQPMEENEIDNYKTNCSKKSKKSESIYNNADVERLTETIKQIIANMVIKADDIYMKYLQSNLLHLITNEDKSEKFDADANEKNDEKNLEDELDEYSLISPDVNFEDE